MNPRLVRVLTLLLLAAPLLYIGYTADQLPAQVASHFNFSGQADGFMPRDSYLMGAAVVTVGLPVLLGLALPAASGAMAGSINLPHREHWMAPERQAQTLDYLAKQHRRFALALSAFMTSVHALVVGAHRAQPPQLDAAAMQTALGIFLLTTALWVVALLRHFRRPD